MSTDSSNSVWVFNIITHCTFAPSQSVVRQKLLETLHNHYNNMTIGKVLKTYLPRTASSCTQRRRIGQIPTRSLVSTHNESLLFISMSSSVKYFCSSKRIKRHFLNVRKCNQYKKSLDVHNLYWLNFEVFIF